MGVALVQSIFRHRLRVSLIAGLLGGLSFLVTGCAKQSLNEAGVSSLAPAKLSQGAWVPSVTGAGAANLKGTVTTSSTTIYRSAVSMVRLNEGWSGKEVEVNLGTYSADVNSDGIADDFGPNGSMSLIATTTNYPLSGGAYPVLTSFRVVNGSTTEYVNLNSTCSSAGMFSCLGGSCSANACTVTSPTSFGSRSNWDQHQIPPFGYSTTNSFPRCDSAANSWSACPTAVSRLPPGTYFARYILVSDSSNSVAGRVADLTVQRVIKQDTSARGNSVAVNGAIDLNIILVGDVNVNDSRTSKGGQNLNLLFREVHNILKNASGIGIGAIRVYEWPDSVGGNQYSSPDYSVLGDMFYSGSAGIQQLVQSGAADSIADGINVFMVRDIQNGSSTSTILGLSGAILGPPVHSGYTSGVAFSTFIDGVSNPSLGGYNPACSSSSCPRDSQEEGFLEMAATVAHEIGHYLGLNHPSERKPSSTAQRHDVLSDTPQCLEQGLDSETSFLSQKDCYLDTTSQLSGQTCQAVCPSYYLSAGSLTVSNFCPTQLGCQFNHVMWYTTKNRRKVSGVWQEDGNLISVQSSALVQWNPFVK